MKHKSTFVVLLTLILAASAASAAGGARLLAAGPGDLAAAELHAPAGLEADALSREPVAVSWRLDAEKALTPPAPFTAQSREFFAHVTAGDLGRGVAIVTTAPGALVRINPAPGSKSLTVIDPHALTVRAPAGEAFAAGTAMELIASADQLRAAGSPFVEGTAAFRLRSDLGAGRFELVAPDLTAAADERLVIHVFDRGSDVVLALRTLERDYLHRQELAVEATFAGKLEGFVSSPAGRVWPLAFRAAGKGTWRASLVLDALEAPAPGLWEVHATGRAAGDRGRTGAGEVLRSARVAFQVAVPSARLDGDAAVAVGDDGALAVRLGVETAAAGRYEVRGVLYASAADGSLAPLGVAHSAAFLAAGHGVLELAFDAATVAGSGRGAPYEIRDLRLIDQGTMGLLHRQARGLVISE